MTLLLPDLDATERLGRLLGEHLFAGSVVALVGPLGAGKTHLTRAIAEGLKIADVREVSSPTFVLMQEYEARLPIYHMDVYRLSSIDEFVRLGVEETFASGGVCLIEWADKVFPALPDDHLRLELAVESETARRATLTATGPNHAELLARVGSALAG